MDDVDNGAEDDLLDEDAVLAVNLLSNTAKLFRFLLLCFSDHPG